MYQISTHLYNFQRLHTKRLLRISNPQTSEATISEDLHKLRETFVKVTFHNVKATPQPSFK